MGLINLISQGTRSIGRDLPDVLYRGEIGSGFGNLNKLLCVDMNYQKLKKVCT